MSKSESSCASCVEKFTRRFFRIQKRIEMTKNSSAQPFSKVHRGKTAGVTFAHFTTQFFDLPNRLVSPPRIEQTNSHRIWL